MRSDSGEILAKIPPFVLISSPFPNRSATARGNPVYTNPASWTLPSQRMLLSPYCRTRAPRGSPFNTPKCPIYNVVVALPRSVAIFFSSFEDKRCGRFSLTTSSIARREEREFCLKFVSFEKMIRSREKVFFEGDRLCKCEIEMT